ncbi:hypothetical protein [Microbispora sp. H11081]|uniref:hypothetical protein n=1 Tax=Microbispora sp. H11081 TaxID=2729107 RepID=UPI00147528C6|nr:hypothetical protein [Microbispora sp. H11081]
MGKNTSSGGGPDNPGPSGITISEGALALIVRALVLIVLTLAAAWLIAHGFDPAFLAVIGKLKV